MSIALLSAGLTAGTFLTSGLVGCNKQLRKADAASPSADLGDSESNVPLVDAPNSLTIGDVVVSLQPGKWKLLDSEPSKSGTNSLTIGHISDPRNTRLVIFVTTARPESEELFNQFLSKLRGSAEQKISPRGANSSQLANLQLDCRSYDVATETESPAEKTPAMRLQACLVANSPRGVFFIQGGPEAKFEAAKADFDQVLAKLKLPAPTGGAATASPPSPSAPPQSSRR